MINFIKNMASLAVFLHLAGRYRIFTHPGNIHPPKKIKFLASLLCLISCPTKFLRTPRDDFGVRLTSFFKELGPIYIKFGQILSTRPDLVGLEVAEHLKHLQDRLPPFALDIVKTKIRENFGAELSGIFSSFTRTPVAAASIAQVHKATLLNGKKVAVKILRPDIEKIYAGDIRFLEFVARCASGFSQKVKRLKPQEVVSILKESMRFELDLRLEAAAASRLTDNLARDSHVCLPQVHWELTTQEIITLEWMDGISIYDQYALIKNNLNPDEIAARVAVIFFNQAFRDGFFHADLHPGNILVKKNGQIVLLDFGIIGILSEKDRLAVAEIIHALLKRDYNLVATIHRQAGYIPASANLELFAQSCRAIAEPVIGKQVRDLSIGNLLAKLFRITADFGIEPQPQLLLLQKTMIMVEGIGQSLNPEVNIWQLAEPWIKKWAIKNLTPEARLLRILKKFISNIRAY